MFFVCLCFLWLVWGLLWHGLVITYVGWLSLCESVANSMVHDVTSCCPQLSLPFQSVSHSLGMTDVFLLKTCRLSSLLFVLTLEIGGGLVSNWDKQCFATWHRFNSKCLHFKIMFSSIFSQYGALCHRVGCLVAVNRLPVHWLVTEPITWGKTGTIKLKSSLRESLLRCP